MASSRLRINFPFVAWYRKLKGEKFRILTSTEIFRNFSSFKDKDISKSTGFGSDVFWSKKIAISTSLKSFSSKKEPCK